MARNRPSTAEIGAKPDSHGPGTDPVWSVQMERGRRFPRARLIAVRSAGARRGRAQRDCSPSTAGWLARHAACFSGPDQALGCVCLSLATRLPITAEAGVGGTAWRLLRSVTSTGES
jgi:hypothetical protein